MVLLHRQLDLGDRPGRVRLAQLALGPAEPAHQVRHHDREDGLERQVALVEVDREDGDLPLPFAAGPVEHRVERIARDRLGQHVRRGLQGQLLRLGHQHVVEPDVGHQGRVLVLLGDDRVVQHVPQLPQRTGAARLDDQHVPRRERVGHHAVIDHDRQPVLPGARRRWGGQRLALLGLEDLQVDQGDGLEHLLQEDVARSDERDLAVRSAREDRPGGVIGRAGRRPDRSGRGDGRRRRRSSRRSGRSARRA